MWDQPSFQGGLPPQFCWTKYGTEAGEGIDAIFERKELEREANGGVFLWGIGNSLRPSIDALLKRTSDPVVCFSPMRSAAAAHDVAPSALSLWHSGYGIDGQDFAVPEFSVVTSRTGSGTRANRHFALVCQSDEPIARFDEPAGLGIDELTNLRTGSRLGSSQVTSVVRYSPSAGVPRNYSISFAARLVAPYFVTLTHRSPVPANRRAPSSSTESDWDDLLALRANHTSAAATLFSLL